ncbi:MAG TPA: hypothetical protein VFQ36_22050 [Ktedonobacteraceae bacterium]|nr:hypothetical protein [Ktedonobacteraceae bacterium]
MNQAKIDLHIGELILRDVPYALRHRIAVAVEQELARLLSEQDLSPSIIQDGHIPQIDLGTLQIAADARADTIGAQIARGVCGNLTNKQEK